MSRIDKRFHELKDLNEGALVCFVTAGDPDIETTHRIILQLEKSGADIVEIGIPFSDPIADGASIQASSMRALEQGVNVAAVLELVRKIRCDSQLPIVLMTYYNPIVRYGVERFAADAASAGVDGVIITDLTPEESDLWKTEADRAGINTIFLLAPTSADYRIAVVAGLTTGFLYCVSRTGVTGAQSEMGHEVRKLASKIRAKTDIPIVVGFGISRPEHVKEVCGYADGAVVGSKLVDCIAANSTSPKLLDEVDKLVSALKSGTKR